MQALIAPWLETRSHDMRRRGAFISAFEKIVDTAPNADYKNW
jgi:hypothetical protein